MQRVRVLQKQREKARKGQKQKGKARKVDRAKKPNTKYVSTDQQLQTRAATRYARDCHSPPTMHRLPTTIRTRTHRRRNILAASGNIMRFRLIWCSIYRTISTCQTTQTPHTINFAKSILVRATRCEMIALAETAGYLGTSDVSMTITQQAWCQRRAGEARPEARKPRMNARSANDGLATLKTAAQHV